MHVVKIIINKLQSLTKYIFIASKDKLKCENLTHTISHTIMLEAQSNSAKLQCYVPWLGQKPTCTLAGSETNFHTGWVRNILHAGWVRNQCAQFGRVNLPVLFLNLTVLLVVKCESDLTLDAACAEIFKCQSWK